MAFHDGSDPTLGYSRFLSCEDHSWAAGAHTLRNPLATVSSVVILLCPAAATAAWVSHAGRRAALAFCAPLWLLFLHNLYHHAMGPPCVDIEGFASLLLANSVHMFAPAPFLGPSVAAAVAAAAAADCRAGAEVGAYQLAVNNALTGLFPLVISWIVVRRESPRRAEELYLLKKLWACAVALAVTGLAVEPNFCGAAGMSWWHPTVVHFAITLFFTCFSNLVLVGTNPAAVDRRVLYDAVRTHVS